MVILWQFSTNVFFILNCGIHMLRPVWRSGQNGCKRGQCQLYFWYFGDLGNIFSFPVLKWWHINAQPHPNEQSFTKYLRLTLFFMCNRALRKNFNFCFSNGFLLVLAKNSYWEGSWALGYHAIKFWYFRDIFYFANIVNLKLFGNSYIPCKLSKSLKILWKWLPAWFSFACLC